MRDLREDSDLRQSDMADILGLTNQQAYQRYEAGRALMPIHLLIKVAKQFEVSLDYLDLPMINANSGKRMDDREIFLSNIL